MIALGMSGFTMDGQQALLAFRGEHKQFDLPPLNEADRLILITTGVDVGVPRNLDGARIYRFALQRIAQLLFELICLRSPLNHDRVPFRSSR
jgi:hypothetical protein